MTDRPKSEPGQETGIVRSQENVVRVDFAPKNPVPSGETRLQVFMTEQPKELGLRFSQPIQEFRMDLAAADQLIGALVQAYVRLIWRKES